VVSGTRKHATVQVHNLVVMSAIAHHGMFYISPWFRIMGTAAVDSEAKVLC